LVRQENALWFREQAGEGAAALDGVALRLDADAAGHMDSHADKPVILGIRPESIVEGCADNGLPASTVEATIQRLEPTGPETFLHLCTGSHSFIARVQSSCRAQSQQRISVKFDMRAAHFFDPVTEKAL
jgi:multiple sugar transport system ATP-binding protein